MENISLITVIDHQMGFKCISAARSAFSAISYREIGFKHFAFKKSSAENKPFGSFFPYKSMNDVKTVSLP
jgi:hypothetical protein